ncbi:hypothetical protein ACHAXS_006429 [Conticribra weissflogii]
MNYLTAFSIIVCMWKAEAFTPSARGASLSSLYAVGFEGKYSKPKLSDWSRAFKEQGPKPKPSEEGAAAPPAPTPPGTTGQEIGWTKGFEGKLGRKAAAPAKN